MALDYKTIALVIAVLSIVSSLSMGMIFKDNKDEVSLLWWMSGLLIGAILDISLIFFSEKIGLINLFFFLTYIMLLEGVLAFRNFLKGKLFCRLKLYLGLIISILIASFYKYFAIKDILSFLILSMAAFYMIKDLEKSTLKTYSIAAISFFIMSIGFLIRAVKIILGAELDSIIEFSNSFIIPLIFFWIIGWSYGAIVAVNHKIQKRIGNLALKDNLTGLGNRRELYDVLNNSIKRSEKLNRGFLIFILDLNGFKEINDTYGHVFGDKVLKSLGVSIQKIVRDEDYAARLGGDEFVVIVNNVLKEEDIHYIKERLRKKIERMRIVDKKEVHLKTAIGWAQYPQSGIKIDDLLNCADKRMYEEKSQVHFKSEIFWEDNLNENSGF